MTDRHWIEAELIVRDASDSEVRRHFEYDRTSHEIEDVPGEILDHLSHSAGDERVKLIETDR